MTYVRIRSWHVLRTWTRVPGVAITRCGRRTTPAQGDTGRSALPLDEKTCETCLRLALHDGETA